MAKHELGNLISRKNSALVAFGVEGMTSSEVRQLIGLNALERHGEFLGSLTKGMVDISKTVASDGDPFKVWKDAMGQTGSLARKIHPYLRQPGFKDFITAPFNVLARNSLMMGALGLTTAGREKQAIRNVLAAVLGRHQTAVSIIGVLAQDYLDIIGQVGKYRELSDKMGKAYIKMVLNASKTIAKLPSDQEVNDLRKISGENREDLSDASRYLGKALIDMIGGNSGSNSLGKARKAMGNVDAPAEVEALKEENEAMAEAVLAQYSVDLAGTMNRTTRATMISTITLMSQPLGLFTGALRGLADVQMVSAAARLIYSQLSNDQGRDNEFVTNGVNSLAEAYSSFRSIKGSKQKYLGL